MRENKNAFLSSIIVSFASLLMAIFLEWRLYIHIISIFTGHREFIINLLIGIFASGLLIAIISLVQYIVIRYKLLFNLMQSTKRLIIGLGLLNFKIEHHKNGVLYPKDELIKDIKEFENCVNNLMIIITNIFLMDINTDINKKINFMKEYISKLSALIYKTFQIESAIRYNVQISNLTSFEKELYLSIEKGSTKPIEKGSTFSPIN